MGNSISKNRCSSKQIFTISECQNSPISDVNKSNNDFGDGLKGEEVKREISKINNLNEKNKLNNLNNTFQQISKLLTNLEAKNQLVMKDLSEIRNTMNNLSEMKRLPVDDTPEVRNEDGATHRRERRR